MKNKILAVATVAVLVAIMIGVMVFAKTRAPRKDAKGSAAPTVAVKPDKAAQVVQAKKPMAKEMGALTVKMLGAKNKEVSLKAKAFRSVDSRSSVFSRVFTTGRTLELLPGTYDVEIETVPAKIYKGINVSKGRETVEDIGRITGSFEVKAVNLGGKAISYPVKVMYAKSDVVAVSGIVNRPMEIIAGVYDVEISSLPRQVKKDVNIDAGKEVLIDIGATGRLLVKAMDGAGKPAKGSVRIKDPVSGELIASPAVNKPIDILPGSYTIETASNPPQVRSDVKINAGEETALEFIIQAPSASAAQITRSAAAAIKPALPRPAVPAKPVAAPAKKPGT